MPATNFTVADIPSQTGRRAIITGANSGIGWFAALELARHGATVVMTARDEAKGTLAKQRLLAEIPAASVEVGLLDLASLASVRAFAASQAGHPLDLLINNAGVMAPPKRLESADGLELQFATNVVGHFALTAQLFPALQAASATSSLAPRVVMLASIAHKRGKLDFADLQSIHSYGPMRAYQQSKLADLMLAFELDRRLRAAGSRILSLAAHPGVANTNLFKLPNVNPIERAARNAIGALIGLLLNSQPGGALPTLYAATAPEAVSGGYYGPQSFQEMRGENVGPAQIAPQALDLAAAQQLWKVCEELSGLRLL